MTLTTAVKIFPMTADYVKLQNDINEFLLKLSDDRLFDHKIISIKYQSNIEFSPEGNEHPGYSAMVIYE